MPREITPEQIQNYVELFIDERRHFYVREREGKAFFHKARRLRDEDIMRHLRGEQWIGVVRAPKTRILGVDLDAKGGSLDAREAMVKRYQRIAGTLPPSLVVRSSESGGLHLYWFLDEEVDTAGLVDAVGEFFRGLGLEVRAGAVEIRPTTGQCLRLPFGRGSVLLRPVLLEPYADIGSDIPATVDFLSTAASPIPVGEFWSKIRSGTLGADRLGAGTWQSASRGGAFSSTQNSAPTPPQRASQTEDSLALRVRELERNGIPAEGQRHNAQFDIIRQSYLDGLPRDECATRVRNFLFGPLSQQHKSRTLRDAPESAWKEAVATMRVIYAKGARPPSRAPLSEREIDFIWEVTAHLDGHERYRQMLFLFDLIQLFKTARTDIIGLPRKTVTRMPGAHTESYQQRLRFAIDNRVVTTDGEYGLGHCRNFRLLIRLDADGSFATLDEAICDRDLSFLSKHMQLQVLVRSLTGKPQRRCRRTNQTPDVPRRSAGLSQEASASEPPCLSSPNPSNKLGKEGDIPSFSGGPSVGIHGYPEQGGVDGKMGPGRGAGQHDPSDQHDPSNQADRGKGNPEGPANFEAEPHGKASTGSLVRAPQAAHGHMQGQGQVLDMDRERATTGIGADLHGSHHDIRASRADPPTVDEVAASGDRKPSLKLLEIVQKLNREAGIGCDTPSVFHAPATSTASSELASAVGKASNTATGPPSFRPSSDSGVIAPRRTVIADA